MERLKESLGKTDNKKGDKKYFEFEVRGTKEDLNGVALEIFSFDKTRCCEFLDFSQAHIKDALYCASLNLEVKNADDLKRLEGSFFALKNMFETSPFVKGKFELHFRSKDKQVSIDVISKEGKLFKLLLDLGIDLSEYHKFNFALKSGINFEELFELKADQTAALVKFFSILFSIKSETDNVKYLANALGEALKDMKLNDEKKQLKFDKFVGFIINFINSFIGFKCKLEYDAKILAGEGSKEAEKAAGLILGIISLGLDTLFKLHLELPFDLLNFDSISISICVPKYQNGYAISIKSPGLNKIIKNISFMLLVKNLADDNRKAIEAKRKAYEEKAEKKADEEAKK